MAAPLGARARQDGIDRYALPPGARRVRDRFGPGDEFQQWRLDHRQSHRPGRDPGLKTGQSADRIVERTDRGGSVATLPDMVVDPWSNTKAIDLGPVAQDPGSAGTSTVYNIKSVDLMCDPRHPVAPGRTRGRSRAPEEPVQRSGRDSARGEAAGIRPHHGTLYPRVTAAQFRNRDPRTSHRNPLRSLVALLVRLRNGCPLLRAPASTTLLEKDEVPLFVISSTRDGDSLGWQGPSHGRHRCSETRHEETEGDDDAARPQLIHAHLPPTRHRYRPQHREHVGRLSRVDYTSRHF